MSVVSMAFLALTAAGPAPAADKEPDVPAAVATISRLAKASPTPTTEAGKASSERLQALVKYLERVATKDNLTASEFFNVLQVTRDAVHQGSQLAEFPEEALCWQKAGLALAQAQDRYCEVRVDIGTFPAQCRDQTKAQVEIFRTTYREALLKVIPRPE